MLWRRKITTLFMLIMGLLAYSIFDWNITSLYSIQLIALLEPKKENHIHGRLKQIDLHGKTNHENPPSTHGHDTASGDLGSQEPTPMDTLSSAKYNTNSITEDVNNHYLNNTSKSSIEGRREKLRESQIEDVVNVISSISKINVGSRIMSSVRMALANLSSIPVLPGNLAKKSEGSLLSTAVPPAARVVYSDTWQGYSLPVLTCSPLGRLGNVMGEYATMFAVQKLYNTSVVVHPRMRERLNFFPNLSLPRLPGPFINEEWKSVSSYGSLYNYAPVELAASGLFGPHRFVMKEYAFEIHLFQSFKKELKQEFLFSKSLTLQVEKFYRSILESRSNSNDVPVFVGFHVRRTDYLKHAKRMFGALLPEDSYFDRAMAHFRKKFPGKVLFIAASDNFTFIREKLGMHPDVIFSPGTTAPLDMAVLSACNHSIVTLGSYGFWAGFLAGGEVVYPDVEYRKEYRFSRAMYEKIGLQSFIPLPVD